MFKSTDYSKFLYRSVLLVFATIFIAAGSYGQKELLEAIEKNDTASFDRILNTGFNVNKTRTKIRTRYGISRKRQLRGKIYINKKAREGIPLIYFTKTEPPLIRSALRNNSYFTRRLIEVGAKPNKKEKNGVLTPLGWAAHNGNLDMVKLLLENGADINGYYKSWKTSPLIEALGWKHWDIAKYLIRQGADITIEDKEGKTALHHAALQKNYELVSILISKKAAINHIAKDSMSVLEAACSRGGLYTESQTNLDIVRLLVENGARTDNIAAELAAYKGEINVVKYLISKGAPVTTEFILAASNGLSFDLFRFLLDSSELKNKIYDAEGMLPGEILLRICTGFWQGSDRTLNISMLKFVLNKGVDMYQLDDQGQNIFTTLVAYGKPDNITLESSYLLIEKIDKLRLKKEKMLDYPLKRAAYQGLVNTCRFFIENGADVNSTGDDGGTILHQACWRYDNEETLRLLVKKGANVNALDKQGSTPAMGCVVFGRWENIKTMIELGADPNFKSSSGTTLLDIVTDETLRQFLISRGAKHGAEIK